MKEKENGLNKFLSAGKRILDIHAPRKRKYAKSNHMRFMNKALSNEIMTRAQLRNKFLKYRSEENKKKYSKLRNHFVLVLRKSKSDCFGNLHEKNMIDKKTFWKTIKPFLSDKVRLTNKMTLIHEKEIIVDDYNTTAVLNTLFSNILSYLNIARIFELRTSS